MSSTTAAKAEVRQQDAATVNIEDKQQDTATVTSSMLVFHQE
jgi:hypothetical protein